MSQPPIAGWYADPQDPQRARYWDGQHWTEQVRPWAAAPPSGGPQPNQTLRRPWFLRKRVLIPAGLVGLLLVASVADGSDPTPTAGATMTSMASSPAAQQADRATGPGAGQGSGTPELTESTPPPSTTTAAPARTAASVPSTTSQVRGLRGSAATRTPDPQVTTSKRATPTIRTRRMRTKAPAPTPRATAPRGLTGGVPFYKNCAAVRAAGKAPLHPGDPGYRRQLDGDGDERACE